MCWQKIRRRVPPDDYEKWMSRGGYQAVGQAAEEEQDGVAGDGRAVIGRAMKWKRKAVTNYCRLRGRRGIGRCWDDKIGG